MPSIIRDGVSLSYEETAGAATPVLFVHGWCCDHTHFAPQSAHFAARGHHVISVDLRGHGKSDKPQQSYTMQGFADDLVWMCGQFDLVKPIVVGHSMGGIVAFDLAARYPSLPGAIVMVDSAVVLPAAARTRIPPMLDLLRGPNYRATLREFVGNVLFIPSDDADRRERILAQMSSAPQHVMISAFSALYDYDASAVGTPIRMPSLYIAANEPNARCDMARLQELAPQLLRAQTAGAGHFAQLEVPLQINAMIDRMLELLFSGQLT